MAWCFAARVAVAWLCAQALFLQGCEGDQNKYQVVCEACCKADTYDEGKKCLDSETAKHTWLLPKGEPLWQRPKSELGVKACVEWCNGVDPKSRVQFCPGMAQGKITGDAAYPDNMCVPLAYDEAKKGDTGDENPGSRGFPPATQKGANPEANKPSKAASNPEPKPSDAASLVEHVPHKKQAAHAARTLEKTAVWKQALAESDKYRVEQMSSAVIPSHDDDDLREEYEETVPVPRGSFAEVASSGDVRDVGAEPANRTHAA